MKNYIHRFGYKVQMLGGLIITVFMNTFIFSMAYAATTPAAGISVSNETEIRTNVLCPIFNTMFWVLMSVSIIMILWGAFTYMRAEDDAEKVHKATKTITYAAVGIVVALCAKAVPGVVGSIFNLTGVSAC